MVFNLIYKKKNVFNVNSLKVIILTCHYLESHVLFLNWLSFDLFSSFPGINITANAEQAQAT